MSGRIRDRIMVVRDGAQITTANAKEAALESLITLMVGRLRHGYPRHLTAYRTTDRIADKWSPPSSNAR